MSLSWYATSKKWCNRCMNQQLMLACMFLYTYVLSDRFCIHTYIQAHIQHGLALCACYWDVYGNIAQEEKGCHNLCCACEPSTYDPRQTKCLKSPITTVQLKREHNKSKINVQMCTCSVIRATNSKVSPTSLSFPPVYIVENILKIIALGPFKYFTRFWNMWVFSLSEIVSNILNFRTWREEVGRKRKASSKYEWIWVFNFGCFQIWLCPSLFESGWSVFGTKILHPGYSAAHQTH